MKKIRPLFLVLALIVVAFTLALVFLTKSQVHTSYYETQIEAATLMQECLDVIKEYVLDNNISIEKEDLNQTGLIGPEISELTTTLGHEDAKRSTLNPNCAAMMVKYFMQAGLKQGDVVAVGTSGSFPGLAISTLCAAQAMNLRVKLIASYGASTFGATRVEFNIATILKILEASGLVEFDFLAVSPGGDNDYGVGAYDGLLYENTRDVVVQLGQSEGVEFIDFNDVAKSIERRLELYGEDVDLFVNIGGASPNTGVSTYSLSVPEGLVTEQSQIPNTADRGLVFEYLDSEVPVINLLYVKGLMSENGLPFDPVPLSVVGDGGVYYTTRYNAVLAVLGVFTAFMVLAIGVWKRRGEEKHDGI